MVPVTGTFHLGTKHNSTVRPRSAGGASMGRPIPTFHEFCGQQKIVDSLRPHCRGALTQNVPLLHMLFAGPSGIGKTALAFATSKEMGTGFHDHFCSRETTKLLMIELMMRLNKADILFLDEVHALPVECQELLYQAIDKLIIPKIDPVTKRISADEKMAIQPFTLIVASDQCGKLRPALKRRIVLNFTLDYYPVPEMRLIVGNYAAELGILFSPQATTRIAEASRGLPRKARHLMQSLQLCVGDRSSEVTKPEVERCFKLLGIDDNNLDAKDRRYLAFLAQRAGQVSQQNICSALGLDRQLVATEIEGYLIKQGLVGIDCRGRFLTEAGRLFVMKGGVA